MAVLLAFSIIAPRAGGLIIVHDWHGGPPHIYPPPHIPRPIPPQRHFPLAPLEISSETIDAKIKDQIATVTIDQEFYNPNSQQLEGTFLFPLPKGAQLDKFKMEIGGKMVEAELLSADKARSIYEDIVRRAQELGVPAAKYRTPAEVMHGEHERERGLFAPATLESGAQADVLVAPFQFRCTPLQGGARVPPLDEMAQEGVR